MFVKAKLTRLERVRRLYKKNPSDVMKAVYAYLLARDGKEEEALSLLDKNNFYGLYVYGNLLVIDGRLEEAVDAFSLLVRRNPFYLGVRKALGF